MLIRGWWLFAVLFLTDSRLKHRPKNVGFVPIEYFRFVTLSNHCFLQFHNSSYFSSSRETGTTRPLYHKAVTATRTIFCRFTPPWKTCLPVDYSVGLFLLFRLSFETMCVDRQTSHTSVTKACSVRRPRVVSYQFCVLHAENLSKFNESSLTMSIVKIFKCGSKPVVLASPMT